jgi:hypothetical protein
VSALAPAPVEDVEVVTVKKHDDVIPCRALEPETCPVEATWAHTCSTCFQTVPLCEPHKEALAELFTHPPRWPLMGYICLACRTFMDGSGFHRI